MKKQLLMLAVILTGFCGFAAEVTLLKTDFKGDKLPDTWTFNTYKDFLPSTTILDAGDAIAFCDAPKAGTSFFNKKYFIVSKDNKFKVLVTAKGDGIFKIGARCYTGKWQFAGAKFFTPEKLNADWKTYEFSFDTPVFKNKDAVERMSIQVEFPQTTEMLLKNITIVKIQ